MIEIWRLLTCFVSGAQLAAEELECLDVSMDSLSFMKSALDESNMSDLKKRCQELIANATAVFYEALLTRGFSSRTLENLKGSVEKVMTEVASEKCEQSRIHPVLWQSCENTWSLRAAMRRRAG